MRLLKPNKLFVITLIAILLAVSLFSLTIGATATSLIDFLLVVFGQATANSSLPFIIFEIRLPRLLLAILVGMSLAVSGAALQGLFRNPLADPGLIGVSSGSALGAITIIVLGESFLQNYVVFWGYFAVPIAAFLGGLAITWLVYLIASKRGSTDVSLMLLTGIALGTLAAAVTGMLTFFAADDALRTLSFWMLGSIAVANWQSVTIVLVPTLISIIVLPKYATALNAALMGEAVAFQIGHNIKVLKRIVIILVAFAVGAAVSVSGIIGFVGLIAPHLVRMLVGPDNRFVIIGSALIGAILLVIADMIARSIVAPAELPVGIPMSLIGGAFFIWLLLNRKKHSSF